MHRNSFGCGAFVFGEELYNIAMYIKDFLLFFWKKRLVGNS